jgi:hypothetical protein
MVDYPIPAPNVDKIILHVRRGDSGKLVVDLEDVGE